MIYTSELMTPDPDIVTPGTSLHTAIVMMNEGGYRHLPVMENGRLTGIITNRDLRLALDSPLVNKDTADRIQLLQDHTVAECMTADPMTVTPHTPIYKVAEILSLNKIGALPVIEYDQLVGIITVSDLLRHLAMQSKMANI